MTPAGRRPGNVDTRQEILDAARQAFAADGFARTTIRRVAADAAVDPALVHHYFGSKADLYAATVDLGISPTVLASVLDEVPNEQLAEHLVRLFLSVWREPGTRAGLLAILAGAMTGNRVGLDAFRDFLTDSLLAVVVPRLPGERSDLRATLAASHLVGMAIVRYVVELEPLASCPEDELIAIVAPRIQSYFDGP